MEGKILLVEDDYALAMGTEYALRAEGYDVFRAGKLEQAYRMRKEEMPDLILLDVMLPDGNGYDFCKKIREEGCQTPIIFLTAVGEEVNIVQGLECGADDYVWYQLHRDVQQAAADSRSQRSVAHQPGRRRCACYRWQVRDRPRQDTVIDNT